MKHNMTVTLMLLAFFVLAQVVGLYLINADSTITTQIVGNTTKIIVTHANTSLGARPETTGFGSFLYLLIGVAVGTILVLVLVKFQQTNIWRMWFFVAVWLALSISIGVLVKYKIFFDYDVAMLLALIFAAWKIFKPNIFIHNVTEVLMYAGIAVMLVPIFDVFWSIMLLLAISLYDMYAVWKSKHMIKMAKFQTKSEIFAGLMIPYKAAPQQQEDMPINNKSDSTTKSSKSKTSTINMQPAMNAKKLKSEKVKPKTAILGGGDVAFPLIFAGAVMEGLLVQGLTKSAAFMESSIIIFTTTIALGLLFFFAKKDKFYPAMPFVTAGCLVGWAIVLLL